MYPTPVIGMVGVLDDVHRATGSHFRSVGDAIVLLGEPTDELGGSEYLLTIHGVVAGAPPACDLSREHALVETLVESIAAGLVHSAHDVSDGGLAVALAECAIGDREHQFGLDADMSAWPQLQVRALLFGEGQARAIVSTAAPEAVLAVAGKHGLSARTIGTVRPADDGIVIRAGTRTLRARATAVCHGIPRLHSRPHARAGGKRSPSVMETP